MSEDSVIFLAEVSSSQVDTKSAVQAVVSPSPLNVPEENVAGERGEERPVGGLERPVEVGGVCETEAGTEADAEDEDEDVDVVGGVDEAGLLGVNLRGSHCQRFFVAINLRRVCPSVSLTSLTFHNVSFQIFIGYH